MSGSTIRCWRTSRARHGSSAPGSCTPAPSWPAATRTAGATTCRVSWGTAPPATPIRIHSWSARSTSTRSRWVRPTRARSPPAARSAGVSGQGQLGNGGTASLTVPTNTSNGNTADAGDQRGQLPHLRPPRRSAALLGPGCGGPARQRSRRLDERAASGARLLLRREPDDHHRRLPHLRAVPGRAGRLLRLEHRWPARQRAPSSARPRRCGHWASRAPGQRHRRAWRR